MDLDIPSMMMVTTLMLAMCAFALAAHWAANVSFVGLGRLALGTAMGALGMLILSYVGEKAQPFLALIGEFFLLLGYLWVWFGIADFWGARTRSTSYLGWALMVFAIGNTVYSLWDGGLPENRFILYSLYVAAFSLGAAFSMVRALGGRVGLYKGIIKRKTIGASLVTAVFLIHALFYIYRAAAMRPMASDLVGTAKISGLTEVEGLFFSVSLMVTVIVMTAERVQADLRIQAMMDPLTQALNRRAFMAVIKTVLARSRRLSEPVSLVMLDIDRFKRINLKHGHLVGDAILSQFSDGVIEGRRAQDVFCRFGGEEFVLLLPGTDEEGAALVASRVRDAVTGYPFIHGKKEISLTVSFGVMTARGDDLTPDSMLDAAYKALRVAQAVGKNHIEIAGNMPAKASD